MKPIKKMYQIWWLDIVASTLDIKLFCQEVQAGAGIVADSNPSAEYQETQDKARALIRALELAQEGL
jgi:anthranilate synthase component 1